MGQNGSNWEKVQTVSIGSMGETKNNVENGEIRTNWEKCVTGNLKKK